MTTEDGYILELQRIPAKRFDKSPPAPGKPVAFLAHCALCTSSVFIVLGPTTGLGMSYWMIFVYFIIAMC